MWTDIKNVWNHAFSFYMKFYRYVHLRCQASNQSRAAVQNEA